MRKHWYLTAILLLAVSLAGCSAPAEKSAAPQAEESASSADQTEPAAEPAEKAGLTALTPETAGEKAALAAAGTDEGRTWAGGNSVNVGPAQGDPFLAGYMFVIHDATTQYQVKVLDGKVVTFFAGTPDTLITSPFQGYNPTIAPETDRQRAAMDAAVAEVAKTNPNATEGGLETYSVYFPKVADGTYLNVEVYADTSVGTYAMGGTDNR